MAEPLRVDSAEMDRLDRSRRVGWLDVDALRRARALVVGAGALGNEVVKDLALSGVGSITVVDMDRVSRSNLNRCMFFREEDAEKNELKAVALARRAGELCPEAKVVAVGKRLEEIDEGIYKEHDLAFGCLDNVAARLHLNAHAYRSRLPLVDGGTRGTSGKVQVVLPPSTPCLQCAMNRTHYRVMARRFSCTGSPEVVLYEPKLAAEITTTSVVAAVQVREGLKVLSGKTDSCLRHVLFYNGLSNDIRELELQHDPMCPLHSEP